jgi:hypothetical protein
MKLMVMTPRRPLLSVCGGVELLASPLASDNHAKRAFLEGKMPQA